MRKLLTSILTATLLLTTVSAATFPTPNWLDLSVKTEGDFYEDPSRTVTREETILFLARAIDYTEQTSLANNMIKVPDDFTLNNYNDLPDLVASETDLIEFFVYNNIIQGTSDSTLALTKNVTRAEIAKILSNLNQSLISLPDVREAITFTDVNSNDWFYDSVTEMYEKSLINGMGNNLYAPQKGLSIAEILQLAFNLSDASASKSVIQISDEAIIESLAYTFDYRLKDTTSENTGEVTSPEGVEVTKVEAMMLIYSAYGLKLPTVYPDEHIERLETKNLILQDGEQSIIKYFPAKSEMYNSVVLGDIPVYLALTKLVMPANINHETLIGYDLEHWINEGFIPEKYSNVSLDTKLSELEMINILNDVLDSGYLWTYYSEYSIREGTNTPSNASDYPFTLNEIPNNIYEMPFIVKEEADANIPVEHYITSLKHMQGYDYKFTKYVENIFNVDYKSISYSTFHKSVTDSITLAASQYTTNEYVDYVKQNQIVLEASTKPIIPVVYYDGLYTRIRAEVTVNVINSNTDLNLLFGDLMIADDVKYVGNTITFIVDYPYSTGLTIEQYQNNIVTMISNMPSSNSQMYLVK